MLLLCLLVVVSGDFVCMPCSMNLSCVKVNSMIRSDVGIRGSFCSYVALVCR